MSREYKNDQKVGVNDTIPVQMHSKTDGKIQNLHVCRRVVCERQSSSQILYCHDLMEVDGNCKVSMLDHW